MFIGLPVIGAIWNVLYLAITTMRNSRAAQRHQMQMKLALHNAELRTREAQIALDCFPRLTGTLVGCDSALRINASIASTRVLNSLHGHHYNPQSR